MRRRRKATDLTRLPSCRPGFSVRREARGRLPGYRTSGSVFFYATCSVPNGGHINYESPDMARRGFSLIAVVILAIISAIAVYTILFIAMAHARFAKAQRQTAQARYPTEAGLVVAMQKLRNEAAVPYPASCTGGNVGTTQITTELVDTNGDSIGDKPVQITVTNCGVGNRHLVSARMTF